MKTSFHYMLQGCTIYYNNIIQTLCRIQKSITPSLLQDRGMHQHFSMIKSLVVVVAGIRLGVLVILSALGALLIHDFLPWMNISKSV
jgi:hypothetical protein